MGTIEVDMFSAEVDGPDHPKALEFKKLLEDVAEEYDCALVSFSVEKGTVSFSFDSDELMVEILKVLQGKDREGGA